MLRLLFLFIIYVMPFAAMSDRHIDHAATEEQTVIYLLMSTFDAGETRTEGFSLDATGNINAAVWTDQHQLLGVADNQGFQQSSYRALMNALPNLQTPKTNDDEMPSSPPVLTAELIFSNKNTGHQSFVYLDNIPDVITQFLDRCRSAITFKPQPSGFYLWAIPAPSKLDSADVIVSKESNSDLARSITQALSQSSVVIPAEATVSQFLTGNKQYRSRFIARLDDGFAYFGILKIN